MRWNVGTDFAIDLVHQIGGNVEELLADESLTNINVTTLVTDNDKNVDSESEESVVQFNSKQIDDILNKFNDLQNLIFMVFSFLPKNVHFI